MGYEQTEEVGNGAAETLIDEVQPKGATTRDPELVAMIKITKIINGLSEEDRGTALRYIAEKFAAYIS